MLLFQGADFATSLLKAKSLKHNPVKAISVAEWGGKPGRLGTEYGILRTEVGVHIGTEYGVLVVVLGSTSVLHATVRVNYCFGGTPDLT